jgi:hypothetical protein
MPTHPDVSASVPGQTATHPDRCARAGRPIAAHPNPAAIPTPIIRHPIIIRTGSHRPRPGLAGQAALGISSPGRPGRVAAALDLKLSTLSRAPGWGLRKRRSLISRLEPSIGMRAGPGRPAAPARYAGTYGTPRSTQPAAARAPPATRMAVLIRLIFISALFFISSKWVFVIILEGWPLRRRSNGFLALWFIFQTPIQNGAPPAGEKPPSR